MVVFTCGHCGESVQKPKVEKHYLTKCRNMSPNLSCMDCFKDFFGNDYEAHIKCVTEEQRYASKGFVAKEKKGEKKQNVWVEMVQSVLEEQSGAPRNVLRIIEAISKHNNTPRKKPKFINFVKNVCGMKTNPTDIDKAWDLISQKLTELSVTSQNGNQSKKENKSEEIDNSNNDVENDKTNGHMENVDAKQLAKNGDVEKNGHLENDITKQNGNSKLSKKQRKEEKKRKKYEAELQQAAATIAIADDNEEEVHSKKKDKKKKNKCDSTSNENAENDVDENIKNKRKRQDTVNGENIGENIEIVHEPAKEKHDKKKPKLQDEIINAPIKTDEEVVTQKFDWHAIIISVLQKKDNEVPFKRLQKKVLAEYTEATGRGVDDRIADKFIKKLKSAPNVRVDKNRVFMITE